MSSRFVATSALLALSASLSMGCGTKVTLTVKGYTSDPTFAVNSYLISGDQDAILVDGQFSRADAEKRIQAAKFQCAFAKIFGDEQRSQRTGGRE